MKRINYIPLYTYEDYRQWKGEWELIGGHPHAMSPSASFRHQKTSASIIHSLTGLLDGTDCCRKGCTAVADVDWIVDDDTVVRPDVMIVCGKITEHYLHFPPALIVEILSPSTALKDRNIKHNLYEAQGVRYYILVEPDTLSAQVLELVDGEYVENGSLTDFVLANGCTLNWDVREVLASIED